MADHLLGPQKKGAQLFSVYASDTGITYVAALSKGKACRHANCFLALDERHMGTLLQFVLICVQAASNVLQARRQISQSLQGGKQKLQEQQPEAALELFKQVLCHVQTAQNAQQCQ